MNNDRKTLKVFGIVNEKLIEYISELLQYHYSLNDEGHDISHAKYVIKRRKNINKL